jgi:hypothetical protein
LGEWQKTGDEYLTRKQIAEKFGYSDGWVQLMLIRLQAEPRRISAINKKRLDFGLDMRALNREKNLAKYWMRQHIQTVLRLEPTLRSASLTGAARARMERQRQYALRGVMRQLKILQRIDPTDPLTAQAEALLDERS